MKKVPIYLIIGLIVLLSLKGCIITTISFDDYIVGTRSEEDGQFTRAIFTPKNELLIAKKFEDITEMGFYKVRGIYAIKYPFGFYHVKSKGTFPFGIRYYSKADKVLDSELILKYKSGESFPDIGQTYKANIVIYKDHFIINNDRWEILPLNNSEKTEAEFTIRKLRESI